MFIFIIGVYTFIVRFCIKLNDSVLKFLGGHIRAHYFSVRGQNPSKYSGSYLLVLVG